MIHERLDLDRWITEFPLTDLEEARSVGSTISAPRDVAFMEQFRRRLRSRGADLGPPTPVDLCVWKLGASDRPDVTKIGGVPFWPADCGWPHLDRRTPLTFVAQLCFADSRDILPNLPGDILSLFAVEDDYSVPYTCWHRLSTERLLPPRKMPKPGWPIEPCHAVLHRTAEYPSLRWEHVKDAPYPLSVWARRFSDGTKMGGTWMVRGELLNPEAYDDPDLKREIEADHAKVRQAECNFIATLGPINTPNRWPFVNVADRDEVRESRMRGLLCIADCGGYDFFFDGQKTESEQWSG